ncbi:MAG: hypothetical protein LBS21_14830 [Clostridiales bacterium]|jgi:hypothetical protein|nr:hypothetical protein [Clostridiales bacterium]
MGTYYRLSGKISPLYFAVIIPAVIAVAAVSVIYSIAIYYVPFYYLNFLGTLGVGWFVGKSAALTTKIGKSRNAVFWALTLILLFAVFTYVHLAAYAAVVFRETAVIDPFLLVYFPLSPDVLFGFAYFEIVSQGVWAISSNSDTMHGLPLIAIWVVEHCIVAFTAFKTAYASLFVRPFFEEAGKWGVKTVLNYAWDYLAEDSQRNSARMALESGNINYFSQLPIVSTNQPSYCVLSYYANPNQEIPEKVYLSLQNVLITETRKGRKNTKETFVVKNLETPYSFVLQIEELRRNNQSAEIADETN